VNNENISVKINCLDKGFVEMVNSMGTDADIVRAARVSYDSKEHTEEDDNKLIDTLMMRGHTSPFEMCEFVFHCKMPIFVARQWVRHRTASINEKSLRYSEFSDEFYTPSGLPYYQEYIIKDNAHSSSCDYHNLTRDGVPKETARITLPVSAYTEWYWKCDLHNIFNFLRLRLHKSAQEEIRQYANAIAFFVKGVAPRAYKAFEKHVLYAVKFSRDDMKVLRNLIVPKAAISEYLNKLDMSYGDKVRFADKLNNIG
jgi:thymidylate synthase (FAD)